VLVNLNQPGDYIWETFSENRKLNYSYGATHPIQIVEKFDDLKMTPKLRPIPHY
jgi:hypothetical protein